MCCVSVWSLSTSAEASCFSAGSCDICCANNPHGTNKAAATHPSTHNFIVPSPISIRLQNERAYYIGCCEIGERKNPRFVPRRSWRYYRATQHAPGCHSKSLTIADCRPSRSRGSDGATIQLCLRTSSRLRIPQRILGQPPSHALLRSQTARSHSCRRSKNQFGSANKIENHERFHHAAERRRAPSVG